jgi:predicted MFS family arabinose efflux permease
MRLFRAFISAYISAFSGISREVWLLAAALLVNRAGTMVLPFLSLYLTLDLGLTAVRAGQVIGCFGLGSMVGSYLGGWLSDRIDPLRVQQLSLLSSGLGFLLFTQLETFAALATGVLVLAALADAFRPALMVAVARFSAPTSSARSFALIRLAANLGMAIGPAAAGFLAVYGYAWLFVCDALTCWAAAVMLLVTFKQTTGNPVDNADDDRSEGRSPWRDGPFLVLLLLVVLLAMAFFQVWSTMPLYLRTSYGMSERAIGSLLALNALLIVLAEMLLIRAVEDADRMRMVGLGALLVCVGLALLPLGPALVCAVGSMVVLTIGEMLSMPITNTVVAERAGRSSTGRYMGAFTLSFSAAFVVGPVAGTAVYQHLGPETLWYGIGAMGVVLAVGFAALSKPLRSRQ